MEPNQKPTEEPKSFKDTYGYDPLEPKAMGYWAAVPSYLKGFFTWESVCSVAAALKRSLTEDELKKLVQVDDINPEIGDTCQFPNCGNRVTAVKGLLVDFRTGEPVIDEATGKSKERGSYLLLIEPDKTRGGLKAVVHLYCAKHAWIARQRPGKPPLHLQSLAQATEKATVLNAKLDQDQASLETFREQTGRQTGRPSGRSKGQEFPGEGQQRRSGGRRFVREQRW